MSTYASYAKREYFQPEAICMGDPVQVYRLVRNQMQEDHEDAWKKLFVVAFIAIIVATVNLQVSTEQFYALQYPIRKTPLTSGMKKTAKSASSSWIR